MGVDEVSKEDPDVTPSADAQDGAPSTEGRAEALAGQNRCASCGEELRSDARFCKHCGSSIVTSHDMPMEAAPSEAPTQAQPTYSAPGYQGPQGVHPGYPGPQPGHPGPQPGHQGPQSGYPGPQPGYQSPQPGYQDPQSGYHVAQGGPSPWPGYPASSPGYGASPPGSPSFTAGYPNGVQGYIPAPIETQPTQPTRTGWIIGGVVAALLAITGIGVGIYVAASGGSSAQAGLATNPAVTVAPAALNQGSPSSPQPSTPTHNVSPSESHSTSPSEPPPPSVQASAASATARPTVAQASETRAVADTIQRHFSLISEHNFSAAYALLAPSLQTGESSWVASHREDGIYKVNVAVDAKLDSADSATARIVNMTTLDAHGCKSWSGSWNLEKLSGQWRISESNISSTPC